jgi:hypothetical protein
VAAVIGLSTGGAHTADYDKNPYIIGEPGIRIKGTFLEIQNKKPAALIVQRVF